MLKPSRLRFLNVAAMLLLFIASAGIKPACCLTWYQPKVPE